MTIQQCVYVLKIAEFGSFNEAAKQLFLAQSSLSVSIKALEKELNIKIFERSGNGIHLTGEGAEFAEYARQIVEHSDFIINRFANTAPFKRLSVATQHYDFVADVFAKLINETGERRYRFSLREMKTYDVIRQVETAYCDVGVLAIKDTDFGVMERYFAHRAISFNQVLKVKPHVYIRRYHALAAHDLIKLEDLKSFPYVSYEQGEHNNFFFTEELANITSDKEIEISDRASLMNCLLGTDSYTIGTGIMPSLLNDGRIVSIPFESDNFYMIGYILRVDKNLSPLAKRFVECLKKTSDLF